MKKLNQKLWIVLSVLVATSLSGVVACGKKPSSGGSEPAATEGKKEGAEAPAAGGTTTPAPAAGVGSVKGKVNFTGTAPEMPDLNRQADPFCNETKMKAQEVIVNENKTLKNVAVRVLGAKGGEAGEAKITVDQKNCMYEPRVQVAVDDQPVAVHNSDPTLHNVHTYAGTKTLFNRAQPKGAPAFDHTFTKDDGEIVKFKCDVHPWMTGWLILNDNGFNAVTGDSGEFEIKNVPAGTYTVKVFHEQYGEKEVQVTVEADKAVEANFDYNGTEKAAFKYREVTIGANHEHHQH